MSTRRALHFVFKVGNRTETAKFYKDVLGMKFLRHEEFQKGCEASCNGPYDGKWSKSMVGYGAEDSHFVVELTYNYGVGSYKLGNDFRGLTISSPSIVDCAKKNNYPLTTEDGQTVLLAPDGYKFVINTEEATGDPVKKVTLASSNLQKSVDFWSKLAGMKIYSQAEKTAVLGYSDDQRKMLISPPRKMYKKIDLKPLQCKLELFDIEQEIDHATAFGRIAFSCPKDELEGIQKLMKDNGQTILTPLVSLDTPGKATVQVVIVADPDGHEICFVGVEAFRELSQVDSKADDLLTEAVSRDKSDEWFAKKGKTKASA